MGEINLSRNNCKICCSITKKAFNVKILNKYDVNYYKCNNCGLLQTEKPFWLNEAYKNPINLTDTGLVYRNIYYSKIITPLLYFIFNRDAKYVDYGGGYGLFTRLMRDIGFDFYWYDLFADNLLAMSFDYLPDMKIDALTAFEVFEHLENVLENFEQMLSISKNIIFSTTLLPTSIPNPDNWRYYGFEHGQHISLFELKTLKYLSDKYELKLSSNGVDLHMLSCNKDSNLKFNLLLKLGRRGLATYCEKKMISRMRSDNIQLARRVH